MKNFRLIEPHKNGGRFIGHHKKIKKLTHFTRQTLLTAENQEVISYMYFGTSLDSFYKIRITYNKDYN